MATDAQPTLDQVDLVVHDMDATLAFYRRLTDQTMLNGREG